MKVFPKSGIVSGGAMSAGEGARFSSDGRRCPMNPKRVSRRLGHVKWPSRIGGQEEEKSGRKRAAKKEKKWNTREKEHHGDSAFTVTFLGGDPQISEIKLRRAQGKGHTKGEAGTRRSNTPLKQIRSLK